MESSAMTVRRGGGGVLGLKLIICKVPEGVIVFSIAFFNFQILLFPLEGERERKKERSVQTKTKLISILKLQTMLFHAHTHTH